MRGRINTILILLLNTFLCTTGYAQTEYLDLSKALLEATRDDKPYKEILDKIAAVDMDELSNELSNDQMKKAFWVNIYNAHVQLILKEDPTKFEDRGKFFKAEQVTVAGQTISLDLLEHGIIRKSKIKLSLGLLPKVFVSKYERTFRVKKTDGRVHFALNCGAKSCPYIGIYDGERCNEQLDLSADQYLTKTTEINGNTLRVSKLFSWFRGDFGGKKGILKMLKKYEIIDQGQDFEIEYLFYDWTLELGNYKTL